MGDGADGSSGLVSTGRNKVVDVEGVSGAISMERKKLCRIEAGVYA